MVRSMLNKPRNLIVAWSVLLLVGLIVPLLIVPQMMTPTFLLGFMSYGASVVGLALGLIGIFTHFGRPGGH